MKWESAAVKEVKTNLTNRRIMEALYAKSRGLIYTILESKS